MRVDVGLFNYPADDGAVVRALARDRERFARLPAGTAEVAVVEGDGGEALLAEALGEWGQSSRLDAADAVGHHHGGVGAAALGQVDPSLDLVTRRRWDLHGDALSGRVVGDCHCHLRPIIASPADSIAGPGSGRLTFPVTGARLLGQAWCGTSERVRVDWSVRSHLRDCAATFLRS